MLLPRIHQSFPQAYRTFASSACLRGHISHVGRAPIPLPASATVTPSPTEIVVSGPLGTLSVPLKPYIQLTFPEKNVLSVKVNDGKIAEQRQMWGTTRSLINNAVVGVTEGFTLPVYLVGVGYRAALEEDPRGKMDGNSGQRLNMKLGYSHSVLVPIPANIKAEVPLATKIVLTSTDKNILGTFAATVRRWRPPEPYKGKVWVFVVSVLLLSSCQFASYKGHFCWQRNYQN